jgi:hypothetical protein
MANLIKLCLRLPNLIVLMKYKNKTLWLLANAISDLVTIHFPIILFIQDRGLL